MKHLLSLLIIILTSTLSSVQAPNQALNFDDVDDYISFANPPVDFANSSFTIQFWAKKDIGTTGWVMHQGTANATNQLLHIGWNSPTNFICAFFGNDINVTFVDDGLWHHWTIVFDNTIAGADNRFIYQDGIQVAQNESTSDFIGNTTFEIGRTGQNYFKGSIDQLSVTNQALSESSVGQNIFCEFGLGGSRFDFNDDSSGIILENQSNSGQSDGELQGFALSGNTSSWTNDVPFENIHFSADMANQTIDAGTGLVLNSNYIDGDCSV